MQHHSLKLLLQCTCYAMQDSYTPHVQAHVIRASMHVLAAALPNLHKIHTPFGVLEA